MQLLPSPPHGADEVRRLQDGEVLGCGLASHGKLTAELAETLPIPFPQPIEHLPSGGVRQGLEHLVLRPRHNPIMQVSTCMTRPSCVDVCDPVRRVFAGAWVNSLAF